MTRLPAPAISVAATRPASPAPTTMTSTSPAIAFPHSLMKPATPRMVNRKPDGQYGPLAELHSRKHFVPVWDRARQVGGRVQRAGNTRCEFNLKRGAHLDKMANSKHPHDASQRRRIQVRQVQ